MRLFGLLGGGWSINFSQQTFGIRAFDPSSRRSSGFPLRRALSLGPRVFTGSLRRPELGRPGLSLRSSASPKAATRTARHRRHRSPRLPARRSATSPIRTPRPRDGQTVVRKAIFGMSEIVLRWYWTSAAPECRLSPRKMPWSNYVSAGRSFCRCRSHRN
jgi:hypothetical protein